MGIELSGGGGESDDDESGYTHTQTKERENIQKSPRDKWIGLRGYRNIIALVTPGFSSECRKREFASFFFFFFSLMLDNVSYIRHTYQM